MLYTNMYYFAKKAIASMIKAVAANQSNESR